MIRPGPKAAQAAVVVESLRAKRSARAADTAPPMLRAATAFDFRRLPAFREIELTQAAGAVLGIESPFFRAMDGRGGATALSGNAELINFSSYDYCGLNQHPAVTEAAMNAVARYGTSCSASRVVGGERPLHHALESALATFLGTEDAVVMVSGHATNVTTIGSLVGPSDLIIHDELIHNSVLEGARLSGAARLSMPHNDLDWLEDTLAKVRFAHERVLIVVEGLYSMDGDTPDLPRLVDIKSAFDAWLMVDEAHALGVLGATGRGIAEAQGVDPRTVEIWMGTLSKTLASTGGYIAGSSALVTMLKARAPGFVFSVGLAPPLAAAAHAALQVLESEPARVARLRENGLRLRGALERHGLDTATSEGYAIAPVVIGDSATTAVTADALFRKGVSAPPVLHPAVPERRARLRLFASSEHTMAQIDRAAELTAEALAEATAITRRRLGRP